MVPKVWLYFLAIIVAMQESEILYEIWHISLSFELFNNNIFLKYITLFTREPWAR
jgi:hypothetical protein